MVLTNADYTERDDVNYLKHTLAFYSENGAPRIEYSPVKVTKSQPAKRKFYGAEAAEAQSSELQLRGKQMANSPVMNV